MKRLKITVVDLVSNKPTSRLYSRLMNANFAAIMPQVVAVWCEQLGHDVRFICYTGDEEFTPEILDDTDVLFVGAFTLSAQLAYAISALFRRHGAVTVLGGPHARCYPEDASLYFDYVLGLTDKSIVADVLADGAPNRPVGRTLSAAAQPAELPGVRERWSFIEATIAKAPFIKIVPMIGSTGCPYSCNFCIDSVFKYQTLGFDQMREDLSFLLRRLKRPRVAWHDPNFGVRFDDYLSTIEEAVPPGRMDFIAESSLSLLSEDHLKRLKKNSFMAMLPGVESWQTHGNKSKSGSNVGMDKVRQVADHVNMILRYIPYVQTNFVLGLDCDEGPEPFELTKTFLDLAPGAYPAFSMLTAYGEAAPLNLDFQRQGRVRPVPFHFLNSTRALNVQPLHYAWPDFFSRMARLVGDAHSWPRIGRRFRATSGVHSRWFSALRASTSKKRKYYEGLTQKLTPGSHLLRFFEGETRELPTFFTDKIRSDLGPLWEALPEGAMVHDQLAYLKRHEASQRQKVRTDVAIATGKEGALAPAE
jgi:hypothetical protein